MADMLTELERKLPPHRPYRGLFSQWDQAMRVARRKASQTGRRHAVRHLSNTHPDQVPYADTWLWEASEVGAGA